MAPRRPLPPLPPDDDPAFEQYLRDVGPGQRLFDPDTEIEVGAPLAAAVAVLAGAAGVVVALGWAALGFAINLGVWSWGATILTIVGTGLVITGGAFGYLAHRDRCRR